MLIGYGVIKGKYLSIPQNFRVNNIQLDNTHLAYKLRGIQISAGNAVSFVALTNIEVKHASLELHNKPQHLFMRNIKVMQESSVGTCIEHELRHAQRRSRRLYGERRNTAVSCKCSCGE